MQYSGSVWFGAFCLSLLAGLTLPGSASGQLSPADARSRASQLCNDSIPLLRDSKLDSAEFKLVEAFSLDPENSSVLTNYGLLFLKQGKLTQARKMLEKAIALNPRSYAAVLNLALTCEGTGDLPTARTYFLKFIDISPDRELAEKMKDHVAIINKTLAAGVPVLAGPDYFAQVKRSQMFPWPKESMPIKIFVEAGESVPGYKPGYGEALAKAIDAWSQALDGIVSFCRTNKRDEADIDVHWTHDFKTALLKSEGGDCKYVANGEGMKHADITFLTVDPSASEKLTDVKVSWVALHELGHALGISAHSNNPQDVMYFAAPLKSSMPVLTSRDVATFKRLYTEKLADTWLSLNDEALKLMRAGRRAEALLKLEQAQNLNPEEKVIKENIALTEQGLAGEFLGQNKYEEAEPHLLKALDLQQYLPDSNRTEVLDRYAAVLRKTGRADDVNVMYKRYNKKSSGS